MQIAQLLRLAADQHEMVGGAEDPLDRVIAGVLSQAEPLEDEELEKVQAAAMPSVVPESMEKEWMR